MCDWEAMVLAWVVHDFIKLTTVPMTLFLLVTTTFLSIGHEFSPALAVLLDGAWLVFIVGVDAVFTISVFVSKVEHVLNGDVLLAADVSNEGLILHTCYGGVDNIGIRDFLELVLALSEPFDIVLQAFASFTLATQVIP